MSGTVLELSVSGAKLRPLLNLFSICVKLSSGGFFLEPAATSLAFRAVSDSKSSHFIAEVPSAYFDAYKYVRPPGMEPLHLQLVSRGVAASILRYCPSITRLVLVYETSSSTIAAPPLHHANAPQDGGLGASQDMISFILYCHSGTTKTFRLHLGEQTVSEKADVSSVDAQMTFRAAAEPRLWTSLVTNFPPTTKLWTIHPTELRLTLTDDGDDVGGTSGSDAHNKNVAVVSADSRSFSTYSYPHPPAIDAHNGALTPGGAASRASAGSVQLPGKTFELKPLKYLLLLADHLQLHIQLSSGGVNVPAVHIEGIRRPGAGGAPPGGVDHQMVSYASLLIAAVDFASPTQQLTNPQRQQSIPRMSSSSSHTPGGAFQRSRPSMGGGGASSNIRSASNFGDHQIDPIMSAAPTAFGNLRTQTSATREASLLAPASTYALEGQSSVAFTAVAPSFVEETPSPQKRRRDDDDDSFCIPGSEARSTASSNPKSYVEGTGRSDPQRSASREGEGIQPSFASSSVAASHVTQVPSHSLAPSHNEQIPNILMQLFPLDFDALASDEDDGDDDHFALETFIASRRVDGTEQLNRSGATPAEGFTAASAYTMIHGTQR
ncbi:rad9-like protein, putative [Bodo saltans]|uniref:Rad9-like protein, putative n=1 Tax=Bodo saltans TaxID=75058 RepID=A0A0S4JK81_BODSA|nr:rad9-like protein, putative [Bodo saltans]|eukprot:CUG90653.1 rad9-like protein, putative [Bodo saltans]